MEQLIDEGLLIRYLTEPVTAGEKDAVEQWCALSPVHEKLVEQFYFALQVNDRLRVIKSVDVDRSLVMLKQQIEKKERKARQRRIIQRLQQAAAIMLLPVILFSAWLMLQRNETPPAQYVEVRSNPGMVSLISLPDESKVWLNGNSRLRYPATFNGENRTVEMSGQGYFEVVHRPEQPFIVTVGNLSVEALGTSFNVTAYDDEDIIETTLVEGSVKLHLKRNGIAEQKLMHPGEKTVYSKSGHDLGSETVNSEYEIAWKDSRLMFKGHSMEQVMRSLGRYYNVRFVVKNSRVMDSEITGKFQNEQLPQVMEYLKIASGIKYRLVPGTVENSELKPAMVEIWK